MDRTKPPPSQVAAREARRERVEAFKLKHGIQAAPEEFKQQCIDYARAVMARHVAKYHSDE